MLSIIKLIRIPNLLIIILSQVLLRFYIISPIMKAQGVDPALSSLNFAILVFIFVLMAGAGYIINDYFDVEIDRINKPGRMIIGHKVRFFTAKLIYGILNVIAIALGFYLAFQVNSFQLGLVFVVIIIMLWYYSSRYKRMLIWGNLVIALILGFTVFAVWLFEFFALRMKSFDFIEAYDAIRLIQYFIWGFTFFAFITTLIREMIKDIEDIEGDSKTGCNTLPIAIGIPGAKIVISVVIILAIGSLAYGQFLLYEGGFVWAFWYLLITVQVILIYVFIRLIISKEKRDFSLLGNLVKVAMLAGIISMQLIYFDI